MSPLRQFARHPVSWACTAGLARISRLSAARCGCIWSLSRCSSSTISPMLILTPCRVSRYVWICRMGRRITVPSAGDQTGQSHADPSLPYQLVVEIHRSFIPVVAPCTPALVDPMFCDLDWWRRGHIDDLSAARQTQAAQTQLTLWATDQPMLHESLVGVERGLARLWCASRFLRAFFCSSGDFFLFAFTKAGGGVFSCSSSSMRPWATRNCSVTSLSCSKACLSCASKDAIVSSAVMSRVYQQRVNLNSISWQKYKGFIYRGRSQSFASVFCCRLRETTGC